LIDTGRVLVLEYFKVSDANRTIVKYVVFYYDTRYRF